MARWKSIESAPRNRPILVDGGVLNFEVNAPPEAVTEPVKVITNNGVYFSVCDTCGYESHVDRPHFWTDLPERHISLALPRPLDFDL